MQKGHCEGQKVSQKGHSIKRSQRGLGIYTCTCPQTRNIREKPSTHLMHITLCAQHETPMLGCGVREREREGGREREREGGREGGGREGGRGEGEREGERATEHATCHSSDAIHSEKP